MKALYLFILAAAAVMQTNAAEVLSSLFDLQLACPKGPRWHAEAATNQASGELMLIKGGKGKIVNISTEIQTPQVQPFSPSDMNRIKDEIASIGYETKKQKFTEFIGTRAYRIDAETKRFPRSSRA